MNETIFQQKALEALEQIPASLLDRLQNVEIIVEDFAAADVLKSLNIDSKWGLLGLYVGHPLTERSVFQTVLLPDRIYLYRLPILRSCEGKDNIVHAIRNVIVHEIGHHFGFDDEELLEMTGSII
ncbi:MAG: metallopeptidase family protein [Deltaproteobacteria bacterium]|nr:metallopeptidase family protein [Deltaproteobacteria bacterium]